MSILNEKDNSLLQFTYYSLILLYIIFLMKKSINLIKIEKKKLNRGGVAPAVFEDGGSASGTGGHVTKFPARPPARRPARPAGPPGPPARPARPLAPRPPATRLPPPLAPRRPLASPPVPSTVARFGVLYGNSFSFLWS